MKMPRTQSMLEKLTEDYERTVGMGNGGHAIGYFSQRRGEIVRGRYEFEKGVYTIYLVNRKYFLWDYDVKKEN